jgi:hypothetical protein
MNIAVFRNPTRQARRPMGSTAGFGLVLSLAICPLAAHAESCGAQILRLETVLSQAQANRRLAPSAPESTAARLHRQPTPQTVTEAQSESDKQLAAALALARKLNAEGKDSECTAALEKFALPLGVR